MKTSKTGKRIIERVALGLIVIIMVLAGCTKTQQVLVREPASPIPGPGRTVGSRKLRPRGFGSDGLDRQAGIYRLYERRKNQRLRRVQPVFRRLGIPGGHKGHHPHLADRVDEDGLPRADHDPGIPFSRGAQPCFQVCDRREGASPLLRRGEGSPAVFQRGEPLGEETEQA